MLKVIVIDKSGKTGLWDDNMADEGRIVERSRASNIETCPDDPSSWIIQLTDHPRNGRFAGRYVSEIRISGSLATKDPMLAKRFKKRADAVAFEIDFIAKHILLEGVKCQKSVLSADATLGPI